MSLLYVLQSIAERAYRKDRKSGEVVAYEVECNAEVYEGDKEPAHAWNRMVQRIKGTESRRSIEVKKKKKSRLGWAGSCLVCSGMCPETGMKRKGQGGERSLDPMQRNAIQYTDLK